MSDPHAAKKGPIATIWGGVGIVIGVGVGLIVLFTLGGSIFGMGFDSFGTATQTVATAMTNSGNQIAGFATGIRSWSSSISKVLIALISALILPVILFFIIREIISEVKKGGGGGHGAAAHPAPAAPKPAAPAAAASH